MIGRLWVLGFTLFSCCVCLTTTLLARVGSLEIAYDPTSKSYLYNGPIDNLPLKAKYLINSDGKVHSLDAQPFRGFGHHRDYFVSPSNSLPSLGSVRMPGKAGLVADFDGLYTLDSQGNHSLSLLFADHILPCEQLDPRDFCVMQGLNVTPAGAFALSFHRSLGERLSMWDGSSYKNVQGALTYLNVIDQFYMLLGFGALHKIKKDVYLLFIPYGKENFIIFDSLGRHANSFSTANSYVIGSKAIDEKIYVWGFSLDGEASTSHLYTLEISESGAAAPVEVPLKFSTKPGQSAFIGIDSAHYIYGINDSQHLISQAPDNVLFDHGLCAQFSSDFISTMPDITQELNLSEKGVWVICDKSVLNLHGGVVVSRNDLSKKIKRIHVATIPGGAFNALVEYVDGTRQRINDGNAVDVEPFSVLPASVSSVAWEENGIFCGTQSVSVPGNASNKNKLCLDGGTWRKIESGAFTPESLLETASYSWGLESSKGINRIFRRERQFGASWVMIHEIKISSTNKVEFVPSSATDQIGLWVPAQGILSIDAQGIVSKLFDANILAETFTHRPSLGSDGWLYGICTSQTKETILCSFDPNGVKHVVETIQPFANNSTPDVACFPLKRGALIDVSRDGASPNSSPRPRVLYHDQVIEMGKMFGEFAPSTSKPWSATYVFDEKGGLFIAKTRTDNQVSTFFEGFYFDGRRLTHKGSFQLAPKESSSARSVNAVAGSTWKNIIQLTSGWDGLLRMPKENAQESVPIMIADNLSDFLNGSLPNQITAATSLGHENTALASNGGIWICPNLHTQKVNHLTLEFTRMNGCEHHGFSGLARQLYALEANRILILSGHTLLEYDVVSRRYTLRANDVASKRISVDTGRIWYSTETEQIGLPLHSTGEVIRNRLPALPSEERIYSVSQNTICAPTGFFVYAASTPGLWQSILPNCSIALSETMDGNSTIVSSNASIYRCSGAACVKSVDLPPSLQTDLNIGVSDKTVFLTSGKKVYTLSKDVLSPCSMPYATGTLPLANVNTLDDGIIATKGGGAVIPDCTVGEAQVFKIE